MYVKTTGGNYFEVVNTDGYGSGVVWKIKSAICDGSLFYYDFILGTVRVYDIEYEMSEEEYVNELAKWLLRNAEPVEAKEQFLKWGKDHGWMFEIYDDGFICGTNGKKMTMVSGGANGICDVSYKR